MLDVGHEASLGPPLGVTHVISCVPRLATQLTLGHIVPLCYTSEGTGSTGGPVPRVTLTDDGDFSTIQELRLPDGDDFGNAWNRCTRVF